MTTRRILGYFVLALIVTVPCSAQDLPQRGRIEGEIRTPSGAPVSGANLRLGQGFTTMSGTDGHFVFESVLAGFPYTLVVEVPGYHQMIYSANGSGLGGTPLVVESGGTVKVKVVLPPSGSLSGKIVDPDGNPVKQIDVAAMHMVDGSVQNGVGGGSATTNELGEFTVSNLYEGDYYLLALPTTPASSPATERFVETYFPNSLDRPGGAVLHVTDGVDAPGNTITLRKEKTFAIRGVLTNSITGDPVAGVQLLALKDGAYRVFGAVSNADGTIMFPHVPSGTFSFQIPPSGRQPVSGLGIPSGTLASIQQVVRDSDITDVPFSFQPNELITGKIVTEDGKPLDTAGVFVTLQDRNPGGRGAQSEVKKDQTFEMRLGPSSFSVLVYFSDAGRGYFLSQVKLDGVDLKLSSPVNIPPGGGNRLELVLSSHAGKISGTVTNNDGNPQGGLVVLARPKVLKQGLAKSGMLISTSSQDGKFQIADVPPGDYYVTTVSDLTAIARDLDLFLDNIARKSEGREEVSVSEDSTASVTLKATKSGQ